MCDYMKHICFGFFWCVISQASDTSISFWGLLSVARKCCTLSGKKRPKGSEPLTIGLYCRSWLVYVCWKCIILLHTLKIFFFHRKTEFDLMSSMWKLLVLKTSIHKMLCNHSRTAFILLHVCFLSRGIFWLGPIRHRPNTESWRLTAQNPRTWS